MRIIFKPLKNRHLPLVMEILSLCTTFQQLVSSHWCRPDHLSYNRSVSGVPQTFLGPCKTPLI